MWLESGLSGRSGIKADMCDKKVQPVRCNVSQWGITMPIHYDGAPSMDAACSRVAHGATGVCADLGLSVTV